MNHSYKTCRSHESLILKLGNHESLYFGSGSTNDEKREKREAQQNRYELIAFDPGIAGYGVSASQNLNCFFFPGEHAPGPPHIIRAFEADSPLDSPVTLVLNVQ